MHALPVKNAVQLIADASLFLALEEEVVRPEVTVDEDRRDA